jgi:hypothetical protein
MDFAGQYVYVCMKGAGDCGWEMFSDQNAVPEFHKKRSKLPNFWGETEEGSFITINSFIK